MKRDVSRGVLEVIGAQRWWGLCWLSLCPVVGCNRTLNAGWNDVASEVMPSDPLIAIDAPELDAPELDAAELDAAALDAAALDAPELDAAVSVSSMPEAGLPPADAGRDAAPADMSPPFPIDPASPLIVNNDGPIDNWQGEHLVLAVAEGRQVLGLIINRSTAWPDLDSNVMGWQELIDAARADGIDGIPDPLRSSGAPLQRPATGQVDDTEPNGSAGARFIVEVAGDIDPNGAPLVVVTGGRLTDVADAYLLEPSIVDRIIVVSSLGVLTDDGARMNVPNGEMDPWADQIVAERLSYVQVSAYYNQLQDLPAERLGELPQSALGNWVANKQPLISGDILACDQISLLAALVPGFVVDAVRVIAQGTSSDQEGPGLLSDDAGSAWLVTEIDESLAEQRLWQLLGSSPSP